MKPSMLFIGGASGTSAPPSALIRAGVDTSPIPVRWPMRRAEFGTSTTSLGIISGDTAAFIDNGSGANLVSQAILASGALNVFGFQTHYHADHIIGIHGNQLLFRKDLVRGIYAPKLGKLNFVDLFEILFSGKLWPVSPEKVGVVIPQYSFTPGDSIPGVFGGVRTMLLNHPGGSVAYRFSLPEGDVVIATDNEITDENVGEFAKFIDGARLIYTDVQYRRSEWEGLAPVGSDTHPMKRIGWGHSTPDMLEKALSLAKSPPLIVLIGHHDPKRPDEDLARFEGELRDAYRHLRVEVRFARECDAIVIK